MSYIHTLRQLARVKGYHYLCEVRTSTADGLEWHVPVDSAILNQVFFYVPSQALLFCVEVSRATGKYGHNRVGLLVYNELRDDKHLYAEAYDPSLPPDCPVRQIPGYNVELAPPFPGHYAGYTTSYRRNVEMYPGWTTETDPSLMVGWFDYYSEHLWHLNRERFSREIAKRVLRDVLPSYTFAGNNQVSFFEAERNKRVEKLSTIWNRRFKYSLFVSYCVNWKEKVKHESNKVKTIENRSLR